MALSFRWSISSSDNKKQRFKQTIRRSGQFLDNALTLQPIDDDNNNNDDNNNDNDDDDDQSW